MEIAENIEKERKAKIRKLLVELKFNLVNLSDIFRCLNYFFNLTFSLSSYLFLSHIKLISNRN